MENTKKYEQAAAEYLTAFIKHLYNQGKSGFEIAEILEIHSDLIGKLINDPQILKEKESRNNRHIEVLKAQFAEEQEFKNKVLYPRQISWNEYENKYNDYSSRLKNIGPWQRKFNFQNGVDFYFANKKKYTETDADVLSRLSTGTAIAESPDTFPDRDLTPGYMLHIINDLSDGQMVTHLSEKYNCSEKAILETAREHKLTLPVSQNIIRERLVKAINEGYNFDQLCKRFMNKEQEIKELISIHRLSQPAAKVTEDGLETKRIP